MELPSSWTLCYLVFWKLDARALACASCVSRAWRDVASYDELWRSLCLTEWPSLSSAQGQALVRHSSYRKIYSMRSQAKMEYERADYSCYDDAASDGDDDDNVGDMRRTCKKRARVSAGFHGDQGSKCLKPDLPVLEGDGALLQMKDLVFLLDVKHKDQAVFSIAREGNELVPVFDVGEEAKNACSSSTFDFFTELWKAEKDMQRHRSGKCTGPGELASWSKDEVREFEVDWAIMAKPCKLGHGHQKVLQMLLHKPECSNTSSVVLADTCVYVDASQPRLRKHQHCDHDDIFFGRMKQFVPGQCEVLVKLGFDCERYPSTSPAGCVYAFKDFRPQSTAFTILSTDSWSPLSQSQVLMFLQHAVCHH